MSGQNNNEINLFKPHTPHGKANSRMIITMIIIWAVAIFGFQALLIIFNEPTPEKNYITFQETWPKIIRSNATVEDKREFGKVVLSVLGKSIAVKKDHKETLKNTISNVVYDLLPGADKKIFAQGFKGNKNKLKVAVGKSKKALGLQSSGFDKLMIELLPTSLVRVNSSKIDGAVKEAIPGIMKLYLVHNQSVLTDTKIFGFPFHYFYVSQFVLILNVLLCLVYCKVTDRIHEKYDFVEDKENG